jgi:succinyl-diaminopimelate desuccinylase
MPFMTDPQSRVVKALDRAIERVCSLSAAHSTAGGTSDARFFAQYGVKTVEFGVKNDTIHAPNERVSIEEVEKLFEVFSTLIENFE